MSPRRSANNHKLEPAPECRQTRARLLAFLDGELDGRTHQALQRHLETCAACRREWEWQRRAEQTLSTARQTAPDPGDMRAAFYARLAATENPRRPNLIEILRRATIPAALALPALAVALVVGTQLRHHATEATNQRTRSSVIASAPALKNDQVAQITIDSPSSLERAHPHSRPMRNPVRMAFHSESRLSEAGVHRISSRRRQHLWQPESQPTRLVLARRKTDVDRTFGLSLNKNVQATIDRTSPSNQFALQGGGDPVQDNGNAMYYIPPGTRNRRELAAGSTPASEGVSSAAIRAELMNEEVSVHIVNDKNEEIGGVDVTPTKGSAGPGVIHIEADATAENAGGTTQP